MSATQRVRRPRVLVVDDHDGFRRMARALLEGAGYEVVGEAADGAAALAGAQRLQPDVVLLDVELPGVDGLEVASRLEPAPPRVILVSARSAEVYGSRVRECGAAGFIPKQGLTAAAFGALAR